MFNWIFMTYRLKLIIWHQFAHLFDILSHIAFHRHFETKILIVRFFLSSLWLEIDSKLTFHFQFDLKLTRNWHRIFNLIQNWLKIDIIFFYDFELTSHFFRWFKINLKLSLCVNHCSKCQNRFIKIRLKFEMTIIVYVYFIKCDINKTLINRDFVLHHFTNIKNINCLNKWNQTWQCINNDLRFVFFRTTSI